MPSERSSFGSLPTTPCSSYVHPSSASRGATSSVLTDPAFLRRYRALHRTPPMLGFLSSTMDSISRFVPTAAFRPRNPQRRNCRVLDCRHGRVLLDDYSTRDFLVWDPISGEYKHIPNDIKIFFSFNAAVVCAAADCDHLDCNGGPFLVVLVAIYSLEDEDFAGVWVYSSEAGEWSTPTTVESDSENFFDRLLPAPVLAGDMLYFICEFGWKTFCYDLRGERGLSVIDSREPDLYDTVVLVSAEDGGLRFAGLNDYSYKLDLWSLETMDPDGVVEWAQCGVIHLDQLFTIDDSMRSPNLIGFANAPVADVVYVSTDDGVFTIELESHKIRKVDDNYCGDSPIFPYASFFTPDRAVGRLCFE